MYAQEDLIFYRQHGHKFWGLDEQERGHLLMLSRGWYGGGTLTKMRWEFVKGLRERDPDRFNQWFALGDVVWKLGLGEWFPRLKPLLITLPWALRQAREHRVR